MTIIDDVRGNSETFPNLVLTMGSFDGVHLGHALILDEVVKEAKAIGGTPAVLTMRPHPREYFSPDHAPNLLTDDAKKADLMAERGIEVVFFLEFNADTAGMAPEAFVKEIVVGACGAKALVVGHDCRFGKGAEGDFAFLQAAGPRYGFTVRQVPPLIIESERVSSTLIRERVLQGELRAVEVLLGRRYSISGEVLKGRGMGEKLGFPTANIKPLHSAVPAQGVYVAEVMDGDRRLPAAVNIGIAPTIRHEDLTIEAHILDFHEDLLGHRIEVVFHRRLRPERKFPSLEALVDQIGKDVVSARKYFGLTSS